MAQALSLPRRHSCRRPPGHDPDSHPETSKPASQVHVASPPTASATKNPRITHANLNFLQPAPSAPSPQATENKNTTRYPGSQSTRIRAVLAEALKKSAKNSNFVKKIYTPIDNLFCLSHFRPWSGARLQTARRESRNSRCRQECRHGTLKACATSGRCGLDCQTGRTRRG